MGTKYTERELEIISSKFKYESQFDFEKLKITWERIGFTINPLTEHSDMVIAPTHDILMENIQNFRGEIKTDCRFFALLIGCLKTNSKSFLMQKSRDALEIMIPEGTYYLTLDANIYVLPETEDRPPLYLTSIFESDQGQWITRWDNQSYIGIVDEGPLIESLQYWINRYQSNIENKINKFNEIKKNNNDAIKKSYYGLLNCFKGKYGLKVGVYKYDNIGGVENIN